MNVQPVAIAGRGGRILGPGDLVADENANKVREKSVSLVQGYIYLENFCEFMTQKNAFLRPFPPSFM